MQIIRKSSDSNGVYTPIRSIVDDFFRFPLIDDQSFRSISLNTDMWEDDLNVYMSVAIPGMSEEDIKLNIDIDILKISAKKSIKDDSKDKDKRFYMRSIESEYEQVYTLPCRVDNSKIEAKLKDGILSIKMPKSNSDMKNEVKITRG